MDIRVFKTFLEVAKVKHFGKASENLYITQAAVSARIKQLEDYYATKLFIREKNNIRLTSAGERLYQYANAIVEQLTHSKLNLTLAETNQVLINIAATPNVWDAYLAGSISAIVSQASEVTLGAEISSRESIHRRLIDKTLDIGVLSDPIKGDELINEKIGTFELVLAATDLDCLNKQDKFNYVLVDWGMAFLKEHNALHKFTPMMRTTTAKIALDVILENGGAAYLPVELVDPYVKEGQLFLLHSNLNIQRSVYLTYHKSNAQHEKIKHLICKLD
ncbi:LysR family transcriptional regulator [Saccharobesus litoralis]|uniref:LysR family transcriptional regulator n=1 Tax=Saccharobesus litoralis TaxID=2172099 RepID=A0A2S0VLP9_9ALTE|nr:LysR family transcriptional regulator [Saccharobesus litoralis]AWB65040.1 LysR family transcriptional regulator [Saccharobesus litoralis]